MHLNKGVLIGRIGERGVKVPYSEQALHSCSFVLEVDEVSQSGKVFMLWLSVEIVGKYAEDAAQSLEPGDEVLVDVKLKYRRQTDEKTGESMSELVVSGWTGSKTMPPPVSASGNSQAEANR